MGKFLGAFIVITAAVAGAAMYYLQVYHFYSTVPATGTDDVQLTNVATGLPETVLYDGFEAIDADSSPIRYRGCFTTTMSQALLSETYQIYDKPEPLVGPGWFDCFDAAEVGEGLENGQALAFLGQENITYGIDRVIAVFADGRGFAWHQINRCGEVVFDGQPVPEGCPPKPEG